MFRAVGVKLISCSSDDLPECHGLQQFPPRPTCYGPGFAHCCEDERCPPANRNFGEGSGQASCDDALFSLSPTFPVVRMMGPSNLIGSALGFFTFAQFPDRPDLNDGPSRFGTMPSQPGAGLLEINAPIALIMLVHNDARGGSVQEVCQ